MASQNCELPNYLGSQHPFSFNFYCMEISLFLCIRVNKVVVVVVVVVVVIFIKITLSPHCWVLFGGVVLKIFLYE